MESVMNRDVFLIVLLAIAAVATKGFHVLPDLPVDASQATTQKTQQSTPRVWWIMGLDGCKLPGPYDSPSPAAEMITHLKPRLVDKPDGNVEVWGLWKNPYTHLFEERSADTFYRDKATCDAAMNAWKVKQQ
jgi:hypothetical protein